MDLPASMKSSQTRGFETVTKDVVVISKDGKVRQNAKIRMVVPDKGEGLISLEFTSNILSVANIRPDYIVSSSKTSDEAEQNQHSKCIAACNANFTNPDGTKMPGRGACKANCWIDTTVRILEAAATIVTKL